MAWIMPIDDALERQNTLEPLPDMIFSCPNRQTNTESSVSLVGSETICEVKT